MIVPYHDGVAVLEKCISSVFSSSYPDFEVILVDDKSSDSGVDTVKSRFNDVVIVRNEHNLGYGGSCNAGARVANGYYLVFLNSDTEVTQDWLDNLVATVTEHGAKLATPLILFNGDDHRINAAGGECDVFGIGWNRGNGSRRADGLRESEYVFYGSACLLIIKEVWEEIDGFDESYFMYVEDVDLCWRAKLAGYETLYVPDSVITHKWRESSKDPYYIAKFVFRNHLRTIMKNYSRLSLTILLPVYFSAKTIELLYFSVKSKHMASILLSGLWWNVKNINTLLISRSRVQGRRRMKDSFIIRRMSPFSIEFKMLIGKEHHPLREFFINPRNADIQETTASDTTYGTVIK